MNSHTMMNISYNSDIPCQSWIIHKTSKKLRGILLIKMYFI